jgi:SnoaL-like domain
VSQDKSPRKDIKTPGELPASAANTADWQGAFAQRSASAFASAFTEDVVLEASTLYRPVSGRENVKQVMEAASKMYEDLEFTEQAADGHHQYVEWRVRTFSGSNMRGVTIITRNAAGAITRLAIHHRPLAEALKFSAEMGRRLQGVVDSSHFLQAEDEIRRI